MVEVLATREDPWVLKLTIGCEATLFLSVEEAEILATVAKGPEGGKPLSLWSRLGRSQTKKPRISSKWTDVDSFHSVF